MLEAAQRLNAGHQSWSQSGSRNRPHLVLPFWRKTLEISGLTPKEMIALVDNLVQESQGRHSGPSGLHC